MHLFIAKVLLFTVLILTNSLSLSYSSSEQIYSCKATNHVAPDSSDAIIDSAYKKGWHLEQFYIKRDDDNVDGYLKASNKILFSTYLGRGASETLKFKTTDISGRAANVKTTLIFKLKENGKFQMDVLYFGGMDGLEKGRFDGFCKLEKAPVIIAESSTSTTTETVTVTNNSTAGQSSQNASSSNNNLNTTSQSTQATQVASAAASGTTVTTSTETVTSHSRWRTAATPAEAQAYVDELQASIVMFIAISEVIEQQPASLRDRVLNTVVSEIDRLRAEKALLQQQLTSRFSTPIRPNNANLSVSAFRAADTFPKIPFYVPGTSEIGEMLVVPRITDDGYLMYQFDFLDPTASYDKVRDTISIEHENIDLVITGLHKVDEWTMVAQENNVTRRIEKTSACIPEGKCENKVQGVSSTEVVFQVYEDGSTAGRIQRNKGRFSTGYNMSVESSILLSAYLTYMRDVGSKEFNIGVMTDDEVKDLFN